MVGCFLSSPYGTLVCTPVRRSSNSPLLADYEHLQPAEDFVVYEGGIRISERQRLTERGVGCMI